MRDLDLTPPSTASTARAVLAAVLLPGLLAPAMAAPDFSREIRPILAARCYACHGPDEAARDGNLRLDLPGARLDVGELQRRIDSSDPDEVMPPPQSPHPLQPHQRLLLHQWLAAGAKAEAHWAFEPMRREAAPQTALGASSAHPIDAFIEQRLQQEGLKLSPPAPAAQLRRRLHLDLLGMEPELSAQEMDQPLDDAGYLTLVQRLLQSPQFGERWGRHWLDAARYADSNGFLGDGLRPKAHRYRDWVIEAFNRDLPYDEFTRQQIAGDLIGQPEGTGFHRNAALNTEAGADPIEARHNNRVDRVNSVARVWMGLTLGCAQCHTHKYDPITLREYYRFYAYFDRTQDSDHPKNGAPLMLINAKDSTPTRLLERGDLTRPGDAVEPGTPAAFGPPAGPSRLDLAQWMLSPQHPLTARVAVNHLWSKLFGHGLVRTPEDFGTSGEAPTHPRLLDWLAQEFIRRGWSRKQLITLMVTSKTYRQDSRINSAQAAQRDPLNLLLWRQHRLRLEGEIIRDSALQLSGLLNTRIGGPSIRPPLPKDVFEVGRASNWQASPGDEVWRRSLYIITLRSVLYPLITTFDGPDAAEACVRRERNNTPLQALSLLNEEVFVQCAQELGRRFLRQASQGAEPTLRAMFLHVLKRQPRPTELQRLIDFARESQGTSADQPPLLLSEHSLMLCARLLLNLDERITRP